MKVFIILPRRQSRPCRDARRPDGDAGPAHGQAFRAAPPGAVTYAKDIAPIIDAQCATCHHAGEVAPFSLTSYATQASARTSSPP